MQGTQTWGPATILIVVLVVFVALIGGVVVVVHPATLSFSEYLDKLQVFAGAVGLLALGRGAQAGLERHGQAVGRAIAEKSNTLSGSSRSHAPPHGGR